jgi:hypothetical protein
MSILVMAVLQGLQRLTSIRLRRVQSMHLKLNR